MRKNKRSKKISRKRYRYKPYTSRYLLPEVPLDTPTMTLLGLPQLSIWYNGAGTEFRSEELPVTDIDLQAPKTNNQIKYETMDHAGNLLRGRLTAALMGDSNEDPNLIRQLIAEHEFRLKGKQEKINTNPFIQ